MIKKERKSDLISNQNQSADEEPITLTERGYAGHFIGGSKCAFHRNTLVSNGDKKVVVSTVGDYRPNGEFPQMVGVNRYYETMVFWAIQEGMYWEADVDQPFDGCDLYGQVSNCDIGADAEADKLHVEVVAKVIERLKAM